MSEPEESQSVTNVDAEIKELLGLFDVPAFVRRGQDLEYALARLDARCRRERGEMLEMVRLRLRQWSGIVTGPDEAAEVLAAPIEALWPICGAEAPVWAARPTPPRRRRVAARELVASIERFNHRWTRFLDELPIEHVNRMIDHYNRYYLLEKECCLGSARLAARHFIPRASLTREGLREAYPLLPVPELRT